MEKEKKVRKPLVYQRDYNHKDHPGEINLEPSLTVPNESYTIQELFQKFANGNMPAIGKDGIYDEGANFDSEDIEKLAHLDLFEKEQESTRIGYVAKHQEGVLKEREQKERDRQKAEADDLELLKADAKARKKASDKGPVSPPETPKE